MTDVPDSLVSLRIFIGASQTEKVQISLSTHNASVAQASTVLFGHIAYRTRLLLGGPAIPAPRADDEGDRSGSGMLGMSPTLTRVSTEAKKARMDTSLAKPKSEELNETSLPSCIKSALVQRQANLPALLRVEPSWTMYKALWLTMWRCPAMPLPCP